MIYKTHFVQQKKEFAKYVAVKLVMLGWLIAGILNKTNTCYKKN